jgi:DNA-binding transcriptional LysR family regulator
MDLNHVAAFVRVVHDGSFTAAAKALGLPKSSVSRSVAQLEEDLGVRLLHRTTRKLHLTEAGTAFYDRAANALSSIEEATSTASELHGDLRGTVRVTAPPDLGVWALASIVARFVRKNPQVRIDLYLSGRVVDLGAEGFDLAVRAGPLRDQSLVARNVGELSVGLYASRKYIERRGTPSTLDEIAAHDCILFRPDVNGKAIWELVSTSGEKRRLEVEGRISADDLSFVKKAILAGGGIALTPEFLTAREERKGKVARVLPEWSFAGSPLHVVYPSARYVPRRVIAFRDYVVDALRDVTKRCELARRANAQQL